MSSSAFHFTGGKSTFLFADDTGFYCLKIRVDLTDSCSLNIVNLSTVQINVSYTGKIIQAIILKSIPKYWLKKKKEAFK